LRGLLLICAASLAGAMNAPIGIFYAKLTSMVEGAKIVGKMADAETASNESDLKARKKPTSREETSTPLESLVGSLAFEVFHYVWAAYPAVELVFEFIISLESCALNPSVMSLRILRPLHWRNTYVQSFLTYWSK